MGKLVESFGEAGLFGLLMFGIFAIAYIFLLLIERVANSRTELLKYILTAHSDERSKWLDLIKQHIIDRKDNG